MKKNNKNRNVIATNNIPEANNNEVQNSYEQTFLQMDIVQKRGSKSIYLSPEHHERLTRIIQVISEDKISIYAYLDNLLDYHFQEFAEQITKNYNDKYKPI